MSTIEKRTLRGTLLGFLSFFINVIQSILLVPFFLTYWGEVKYGQFIGIYAFIQLMRTLDAGHQTFIGNQFNLLYHRDRKKAHETLASSTVIAFFIGCVEFLIFTLVWFLGLGNKIMGIDIRIDSALFFGIGSMLVMWWLVGSVGGILVKAIVAKGLFAETTMFAIGIKIVEILFIALAIWTKLSLSGVFVLLAVVNFIFSVIVLYWIYQRMPEYFPWWKGWNFKTGISNLTKSIVLTINGFLEQLNSSGLIFIVSHYLSSAMIPVFSTVRTLTNTMNMITNIIILPLVPEMIRFHSEENKIKIVRVIQANWFFSGLLVNVGFLVLIPVARQLYSVWTNHKLELNNELFYFMLLSVVLFNYGRSLTSYLTGINDLKSTSIIVWVRTIIILGISLLFIKTLGIISIGIGIFLSEIVCSVVLPVFFIRRHIKDELIDEKSFLFYAIPIFTMAATIYVVDLFYDLRYLICFVSLMVLLSAYYYQWIILDVSVRSKLIGLLYKYKLKYLKY